MAFKTPKEIVTTTFNVCCAKVALPPVKMLVLGFLAGAYIGFGGLLAILVGRGVNTETLGPGISRFVFGAVFPVGLMLVVIAGSELFTGNCGLITPGCLARRATWVGLLRNWVLVYIGNFAGSLFLAYCLGYLTGLTSADPYLSATKAIAESKVQLDFWQLFWRAVGCNWLVNLAIWLALASDDIAGKILGIWFPIMAFVAMGFEHSVANMFFIPLGMFNGANVSWVQFLVGNLVPVTIGNIIGGAFLVGAVYWWLYGRD